ncbi:MAG: hypothetical protein ACK4SR_13575 [Thiobacillus sp.]
MSAYFDIRNGLVAIVETDAPEEGFVKLTSRQSRLAARYRVEDGKVVDAYPGKTDEEVLAEIAAAQAAQAAPPAASGRVVGKLAFMERFGDEELAAIYAAAKTDVRVEVWMDKLKLAGEIDLDDPRVMAGLQALEGLGLIGAGRAAEIVR